MRYQTPVDVAHLRFDLNTAGRDFIVGDIHGTFSVLEAALEAVRFNRATDRLFALGDLVNGGPQSTRVLEFLGKPWFHSIRGENEDILLGLKENEANAATALTISFWRQRKGMQWWSDVVPDFRDEFIDAVRGLPLMITLPTRSGTVGLVHGSIPAGASWTDGIRCAEQKVMDPYYEALYVLWNRNRVDATIPDEDPRHHVAGIDRMFIGHTPVEAPKVLSNVVAIDTASSRGVTEGTPERGYLTIVEATASLSRIRNMAIPPKGQFLAIENDERATMRRVPTQTQTQTQAPAMAVA